MINNETHTLDWILSIKKKLGKRIDPKLIEKVIWAFMLLEQIKLNGLNFTFKGGTALLLATEKPKRFSIDIDINIITEYANKVLNTIIQKMNWLTINCPLYTIKIGKKEYLLFNNTRYNDSEKHSEQEGYPFPIKLKISSPNNEEDLDNFEIKKLIE